MRVLRVVAVAALALSASCGARGVVHDFTHGVAAAAWGGLVEVPADQDRAEIQVEMKEFRFSPAEVHVKQGQTVRFVFHDRGSLAHDAFFGPADAQDARERAVSAGAALSETGGAPWVDVQPGADGAFEITFTTPGRFAIGCHISGHWVAGMSMVVVVAPRTVAG